MGFEVEMARAAIKKHSGDVTKAIDDLVTNGGHVHYREDESPGTSSDSSGPSSSSSGKLS